MNEIFLDIETTGLSYQDNHKIVEIACIETKDLVPTSNIFHKLINPKRDVPHEAFKIHGFSSDFLKDKEEFREVADDLLSFVKNKKIIIHNASFDVGFLNNELKILNKGKLEQEKIVDSLQIARSKYPGTSNSLDALCRRFNINLSRRSKHNALLDCELLREVYINLLDAKEPKLIFSAAKMDNENNADYKKTYSKKVLNIPKETMNKHSEFLKKNLKKNYF